MGSGAFMTELIERLNHSKQGGQVLEGFKILEAPQARTDGLLDLPQVEVQIPTYAEEFAPRLNVNATMEVELWVSTKRTAGLGAHIESVAKTLNAIELNRSTPRRADPGFLGNVAKAFNASVTQSLVLDNSFRSKITVNVELRLALRGER